MVIIYDGIEKDKLLDIAAEINLDYEDDKIIILIPLSRREFKDSFPFSSILQQIFEGGCYLYLSSKGRELSIVTSKEYINLAEEKLNKREFSNSFFSLYYASLILLNAGLGAEESYSSDRGDIFEQFRENFILTGKVPPTWSEKIDRLRELNKKLNQNPDIAIDKKELTSLIDFLRELYLYVKD